LNFADLFDKVKNSLSNALNHQEIPFETLIDHLIEKHPDKPISHVPFFQVEFIYNAQIKPRLEVQSFELKEKLSAYDISLTVDKSENSAKLHLAYNVDLFDSTRIQDTLTQFQLVISQILKNQVENIMKYSLRTPLAHKVLPSAAGLLDTTWPGPIPHIFSKNAKNRPDRIAIVFQDEKITYGQLEDSTNRLANFLLSKGIKTGDVIGLYGHRSPSVVWAIMAILKVCFHLEKMIST
jgi:non-ribosomal peptide synthetase component F